MRQFRIVPRFRSEFIPAQFAAPDARYRYQAPYIPDFAAFRAAVLAKTVLPYQVEWQPGPPVGSRLCWLPCPYCYGGSAEPSMERLPVTRALTVLDGIAARGVSRIIFAGYATDPLFSPDLEDLLAMAVDRGMTVGVNTKALRISRGVQDLLCRSHSPKSYVNVSVDAGSDSTYAAVHGLPAGLQLYGRVRQNVNELAWCRDAVEWDQRGTPFEIMVTYLVTPQNASESELRRFVEDFQPVANLIRFAFPQQPRGTVTVSFGFSPGEREATVARVRQVAASLSTAECPVLFVDTDAEHGLFHKPRTLPCVARWVYPTIGFDGWLYHCSQSAAPNFRNMALGNLAERDFWECYYDYDPDRLAVYFDRIATLMVETDCRCDRKEHLTNLQAAQHGGV